MSNSQIKTVLKYAEKSNMTFRLGCGIFAGKKLIAAGYNVQLSDCSRHAEMSAIENFMRRLGMINFFRDVLRKEERPLCRQEV